MPVTIKLPHVRAESVSDRDSVQEPLALLEGACKSEYENCSEFLESSFSDFGRTIIPSPNGFVLGAIEACNNHHHLQLRPEDIWFAILTQFRFYLYRKTESQRWKFVTYRGKEELIMEPDVLDHHDVDFGLFAKFMSHEIDWYLSDRSKKYKDWVTPEFTTTTEQDKVVASVLFMGLMKDYFVYTCYLRCGLPSIALPGDWEESCGLPSVAFPEESSVTLLGEKTDCEGSFRLQSVTLLGEKSDWEEILRRLDKLEYCGDSLRTRFKPVITRFILSFENPDSDQVRSFWNQIAHKCELDSGPVCHYSGWISAFCHKPDRPGGNDLEQSPNMDTQEPFSLDGVVYDVIDSNDIPPGYASVPIKIVVFKTTYDAVMGAGSVGLRCTKSTAMRQHEDTLSAETGWWIFEKKPDEDTTKEKSPEPAAPDRMPGSLTE